MNSSPRRAPRAHATDASAPARNAPHVRSPSRSRSVHPHPLQSRWSRSARQYRPAEPTHRDLFVIRAQTPMQQPQPQSSQRSATQLLIHLGSRPQLRLLRKKLLCIRGLSLLPPRGIVILSGAQRSRRTCCFFPVETSSISSSFAKSAPADRLLPLQSPDTQYKPAAPAHLLATNSQTSQPVPP